MTRLYSAITTEQDKAWLRTLIDSETTVDRYREAMFNLGLGLGDAMLSQISSPNCNVYLACTAEDADFLAKGILSRLEQHNVTVAFACFWNQRLSPFEVEDLQIAPIIKKYQEPLKQAVNYLIVIKSIISGACVVRTNLMDLIQTIDPGQILIAAPVIYETAEASLKQSFEPSVYNKFQYFYFARDDERTATGEVIPGIGGMIYDRLGFLDQDGKNAYVPEIVKVRRSLLTKAL
jgi:hypothetical protein